MAWKLKRTTQCAKCPWRKDVDPYDIPNGYSEEKHKALSCTIQSGLASVFTSNQHVMACHESHDAHCVGWLMNQIGPGNNIGLRIQMMKCANAGLVQLRGEQHETFEQTLPQV